jgi:hypothetical protein
VVLMMVSIGMVVLMADLYTKGSIIQGVKLAGFFLQKSLSSNIKIILNPGEIP